MHTNVTPFDHDLMHHQPKCMNNHEHLCLIDAPTSVQGTTCTYYCMLQSKAKVDVAVWAGLVPENAHDHALLQSMLDNGALGFKSFMSPAGM